MTSRIAASFQEAVRQHKSGRLAEAERLYREVLRLQPQHADANHNLGVLAVTAGKPELALPLLKAALQANPSSAQYWVSYIDALIRAGQTALARTVLDEGRRHGLQGAAVDGLAARLPPVATTSAAVDASSPPAHAIDALLSAHRGGRLGDAQHLAAAMTRDFPHHPLGWAVLGRVYQRQGRLGDALSALLQARRLAPEHAAAHLQLADLLAELGRFEEAEAACREAVSRDPGHAPAHSQLGAVLRALGRLDEAEASCRQAIALQPDLMEAHGNLGMILRGQGRLEAAEASFRQALALRPDHAGTHANLAAILIDRGDMTGADASCRKAITLQPGLVAAHVNLGVALMGQGRFADAVASCRQALALDPGCADAHSNLLYSLNFMAEVPPQAALDEALAFGHQQRLKVSRPHSAWRCAPGARKLRVGFVSGDLRSHPVGYFMQGLLGGIGEEALELVAYPTNGTVDSMTHRLKAHFQAWQPIGHLDDEAAARRIHDDGIHVLIDLAGHTAHNRLPVFMHRPAPVQVAWLGYFATTGLREIDYVLGDPWVTPPEEAHHFVEDIWRLPETYLCFAPPDVDLPVGQLPALANGHLTFGCFNNLSKVNDASLALWARVLHAVAGSRLLLKAPQLADPHAVEATQQRLARLGITPDRCSCEGPSSRLEYLAAYHRVDVALDPFPFPGGTTSVEALWMGVPVLTLKGDRLIAHNGETIAHNSGQSDWIAQDGNDFVDRALRLTADVEGLARSRSTLRAKILAAPLFDSARFARHFADAMRGMWAAKGGRRA